MKNFIVSLKLSKMKIKLFLEIKNAPLHTRELPSTLDTLAMNLPSIFTNSCFNKEGLSFYDEVQNTEVGHLFEHILLEYMCLAKIKYSHSASFEGRTFWMGDNAGKSRIEISCPMHDWTFFSTALSQGIILMDQIFESSMGERVAKTTPVHPAQLAVSM